MIWHLLSGKMGLHSEVFFGLSDILHAVRPDSLGMKLCPFIPSKRSDMGWHNGNSELFRTNL